MERIKICLKFYEQLQSLLGDDYESIGSCNQDVSMYLVPKGTTDQISYYGKPEKSFRVSDHWNWYSSFKKCKDLNYVQCETTDIPGPRERPAEEAASKPRTAAQVAYFRDGKYHRIFGEKYNTETGEWEWLTPKLSDVINEMVPELIPEDPYKLKIFKERLNEIESTSKE